MKKRRKSGSSKKKPVQKLRQETSRGGDRPSLAEQRMQLWLDQLEQLRLSDYLRYVENHKKLFWNSFLSGIARGVGMAIGFTLLGAVLVLLLQDLARHNLPLIGEWLDKLMHVMQNGIN